MTSQFVMAQVNFKGNPVKLSGELPQKGTKAPAFSLTKSDLSKISTGDLTGKKVLLNIFPSIDTAVCATSVRKFNQNASELQNTTVVCVSRDLPFAQKRFCAAENIANVITASDYQGSTFGDDYGLMMTEGALSHLFARAVVVLNESGEVIYSELVPEIGQEPNYEAALAALK